MVLSEKLWNVLAPVIESEGMEPVEVEFKKEGKNWVLRVFIDKEGGITLDDCSSISREISLILDVEDIIPYRYTLEVSSPGLDRPLKKLRDYIRFTGNSVRITTHASMGGRKKYLGRIIGVEDENVLLDIEAEKQKVSLPFKEIHKANLEVEF